MSKLKVDLVGSIEKNEEKRNESERKTFCMIMTGYFVLIVVLFAGFVRYPPKQTLTEDVMQVYQLDVTVMCIVGFGQLMCFMSRLGMSAVGLSFLVTVMAIPTQILCGQGFSMLMGNNDQPVVATALAAGEGAMSVPIVADINALLQGDFAAAAVLISLGAVIGKISPGQCALMTVLEIIFQAFNKEILCVGAIGTLDMGGTIFVHLFGAYFGLTISKVLGKNDTEKEKFADAKDTAVNTRVSDVFSLLGTTLLWIYWPSFNGATAPTGNVQQLLTTINTVMALCASCAVTFLVSYGCNKKIDPVAIQNATLAGGVSIGASSNLLISPAGALCVGAVAGVISTLGFTQLQEIAEDNHLKVHDSCGVHNLHGLPAVWGSIAVSIFTSIPGCNPSPKSSPWPSSQGASQIGGACVTMIVAISSGLIVGYILKCIDFKGKKFEDSAVWKIDYTEDIEVIKSKQ